MISSVLGTYWLSSDEYKNLCLSTDWQFWKVNKYSIIYCQDGTCKKIESYKEKIIGFNPKSNEIYEENFYSTCLSKCAVLFIYNLFFTIYAVSFEVCNFFYSWFESDILSNLAHLFWCIFGIQLACVEALLFDAVYGALTVSYLYKKLNRDVPLEAFIFTHPYRHLKGVHEKLIELHKLFYIAPCMQPKGKKGDMLELGDHTDPTGTVENKVEYEKMKKEARFEFLNQVDVRP